MLSRANKLHLKLNCWATAGIVQVLMWVEIPLNWVVLLCICFFSFLLYSYLCKLEIFHHKLLYDTKGGHFIITDWGKRKTLMSRKIIKIIKHFLGALCNKFCEIEFLLSPRKQLSHISSNSGSGSYSFLIKKENLWYSFLLEWSYRYIWSW